MAGTEPTAPSQPTRAEESAGAARAVSGQADAHRQQWVVAGAVVVLALIFALVAAWFMWPLNTTHQGRTVGDAASQVTGPETTAPEDADDEEPRPGYRLVELAEALGIPEAAMPKQAFAAGDSREQSREELEAVMDTAVSEGRLNEDEAQAVLKAFDEGLIESQSGPLVASNDDQ